MVDLALFVAQGFVLRPNSDYPSVRQNNFGRKNMIGSRAVDWNARTGRIVCDHTADGGARAGRDVGAETKSVRIEKSIQLIEHDTRDDSDAVVCEREEVE